MGLSVRKISYQRYRNHKDILDISITKEHYEFISKLTLEESYNLFKDTVKKEQIIPYTVSFEDAFIALTGKY